MSCGQAALTLCLPGACLLVLMILLEDDLPRPLTIGQVILRSYSPSEENYLSRTTRWDFFQWQKTNKQTKKRLQYGYMAHNEMVNRQVVYCT